MAAVAQSLVGRATPVPQYTIPVSDADAEGDEDAEGDLDMEEGEEVAHPSRSVTHADKSEGDAPSGSEEDDDEMSDEVVEPRKTPRNPRARDSDDDDAVVPDDASQEESGSAEDDDESDKSSSEEGSAAAPEWEGGSDAGEDALGEVANRNNCVYVALM